MASLLGWVSRAMPGFPNRAIGKLIERERELQACKNKTCDAVHADRELELKAEKKMR